LDFTAGGTEEPDVDRRSQGTLSVSLRRLRRGLASLVVEGFVVAIGLGGFLASRRG
jgi:hypothetical protein